VCNETKMTCPIFVRLSLNFHLFGIILMSRRFFQSPIGICVSNTIIIHIYSDDAVSDEMLFDCVPVVVGPY
jgi:hypothetical protein